MLSQHPDEIFILLNLNMAILLSERPQVLRVIDRISGEEGGSRLGIPKELLVALAWGSLSNQTDPEERQRLLGVKSMGSVSVLWSFMGRYKEYYPGEEATYTIWGEDFRPSGKRSKREGEMISLDNTAILFASGVERLKEGYVPYYSLHARVTSLQSPGNSPEVVLGRFAGQFEGTLNGNVVSVQDPKDGVFQVSHWGEWVSPEVYVYNLGFVGNNPGYPYRHRLTVESCAKIPEVLLATLRHTAAFVGTLYTVAGQNPPEFTVVNVINEEH